MRLQINTNPGTMRFTSRWLARLRYNRQTKHLKSGFKAKNSKSTHLIRADKDLILEQRLKQCKNTTEVCNLPFVFPNGDQSAKRFVLFDHFYCVFPAHKVIASVPNTDGFTEINSPVDPLRAFTIRLSKAKTTYPLAESNALKRENKKVDKIECLMALNYLFISNKFNFGGYVMASDDDNVPTLTLIYYRTQGVQKDIGIPVDQNIFNLLESTNDETTHVHVHNEWVGEITKLVSMAQKGTETNIVDVPLDKTLYATVTVNLKPEFFTQQEHLGNTN